MLRKIQIQINFLTETEVPSTNNNKNRIKHSTTIGILFVNNINRLTASIIGPFNLFVKSNDELDCTIVCRLKKV